jgi:DNA repair photolyase
MPGTQIELPAVLPPSRPAVLDQRQRGTSFHQVPVRAILNSPATTGMGFWSLNPYVGCEFGCTYCYARETHKWVMEKTASKPDGQAGKGMAGKKEHEATAVSLAATDSPPILPSGRPAPLPPWLAFEKQILVKTTAAAVLKRTLFPKKLAGCTLMIGTATDPYQPAERRFRLTREILEALLGWRGLTLGIITKSPLILRDQDLLVRLAERHDLTVNISLASTDAGLLRRIEARSPAPHARLRALERLAGAGLHAGLLIAPILPGLTDSRESLAELMRQAKAAGARFAAGFPLRLGPATRERLLPHLAEEFPELARRYARHYADRSNASREYVEALTERIRGLQREFGFEPQKPSRRRAENGGGGRGGAIAPPLPDDGVQQWSLW